MLVCVVDTALAELQSSESIIDLKNQKDEEIYPGGILVEMTHG
jgi:hypothetical protein